MDEKQNVHNIYPRKITKIVLSLKISPLKNDSTFTVLLQKILFFALLVKHLLYLKRNNDIRTAPSDCSIM